MQVFKAKMIMYSNIVAIIKVFKAKMIRYYTKMPDCRYFRQN